MRFMWGEPKRQANLKKHGFDLADFEDAFSFERFITLDAEPSKTGRARFKLIGSWNDDNVDDVVVVAIVSPLGSEAIDIVSVRRASKNERALYVID